VLPFADHITVLSEQGRIVDHDTSPIRSWEPNLVESAAAGSMNDDNTKESAEPGHEEPSVSASTTEESQIITLDVSRQTGDMSVYLYYARAAGLSATLCFLSVTMACTFCESFAGRFPVHK